MRKVKILEKKIVFDDFYKMEEAQFQYEKPNGEMTEPITRLSFERGNGVAGIVYNTDTAKAILVKQFRYPCYHNGPGWIVEVVAGMLGAEEDPAEAMKREVLEEIGYEVKHIEKISTFYVSPGGTSEKIYTYYIEVDNSSKVHDGGGLLHEQENIEVLEYSLAELKEALKKDEIPDAKSIIACNYLLQKQRVM
jgi:nudix-type nucleoside diphosphatase (YffH/AdpP family)